jgi:hypothetical protein
MSVIKKNLSAAIICALFRILNKTQICIMKKAAIEIEKPCLVNLDSVVPDEKGRFCMVCQKSVIDFTKKSPEEIESYFQKNGAQRPCGTFNSWDVKSDRKVDRLIIFLQQNRLKFLAVFIIGLMTITGCRTRTGGPPVYGGENARTLGGMTAQPIQKTDSLSAPDIK